MCFCVQIGTSQQNDYIRFNYLNQSIYNPSSTANSKEMLATVYYQNAFSGIDRAPSLMFAAVQYPFQYANMSLGGSLYSEKAGLLKNTSLNINYAYKMRIGFTRTDFLSAGLGITLSQFGFDVNEITSDVNFSDPLLPNMNSSGFSFNASVGVTYNSHENFRNINKLGYQIGLAGGKLVPNNINFDQFSFKEGFFINHFSKLYYRFNDGLIMKTMLEALFENTSLYDFRVSSSFEVSEILIAGLSLDKNFEIGFEAGVRLDNLLGDGVYHFLVNATLPTNRIINYVNSGFGFKFLYSFDLEYY